jgi:hypothetical protein
MPFVPILSQVNPVHNLSSLLILSSYLHLSSVNLVPSASPTKTQYVFVSPPCMPHPSHLILPGVIIWIKFGVEYKLWSSSLWNFLQSLVASLLYILCVCEFCPGIVVEVYVAQEQL